MQHKLYDVPVFQKIFYPLAQFADCVTVNHVDVGLNPTCKDFIPLQYT